MVRCLYCGKEISDGDYCDAICRYRTERFDAKAQKNLKWFVLAIILTFSLISVPIFTGEARYYSLVFAGLGLTFIVFPYATPETNSWRGVVNGVRIVRIGGLIMCGVSLLIYYLHS